MLHTAAGHCYLAHCETAERNDILAEIEQLGNPEDRFYLWAPDLQRMLCGISERGYAARYHER